MTQRSAMRRNAGKRGAAQRRVERFGDFYARRNLARYDSVFGVVEGWRLILRDAFIQFPRSPNLRTAFKRGALTWIKSQPVEF